MAEPIAYDGEGLAPKIAGLAELTDAVTRHWGTAQAELAAIGEITTGASDLDKQIKLVNDGTMNYAGGFFGALGTALRSIEDKTITAAKVHERAEDNATSASSWGGGSHR